jgi:tetratricopeptide (TPR) repeat protein
MGLFSRKKNDDEKVDDFAKVVLLAQSGNHEEALALHEKIFDKKSGADWYTKGNLLCNLDKENLAINCYEKAIKIVPKYVKAHYRLGQILFRAGRYSDASTHFVEVSLIEGAKGESEWNGACIFHNMLCVHEAYKEDGNPYSLESRTRQIGILRRVLMLNDITDDDQFVDYCVKHYTEILDAITPNTIVEVRTDD